MKSFVAWSHDRSDKKRDDGAKSAPEPHEFITVELELHALREELLATLMLYEVARSHENQKVSVRRWMIDQSIIVQSALDEKIESIRTGLVRALSDATLPLLNEVVEKKAVEDFCAVIERVAAKKTTEGPIVKVPSRLHDTMKSELQRRGILVATEVFDEREILFEQGDTCVQSQIGASVDELHRIFP
jgi:hypothetical protein